MEHWAHSAKAGCKGLIAQMVLGDQGSVDGVLPIGGAPEHPWQGSRP